MRTNLKVIASSFAAICIVLGFIAVYVFTATSGWILIVLGFTAFILSLVTRQDHRG